MSNTTFTEEDEAHFSKGIEGYNRSVSANMPHTVLIVTESE